MLKWKFSFCFLLVFGAFNSQTLQDYELKLISKLEDVHFEKPRQSIAIKQRV